MRLVKVRRMASTRNPLQIQLAKHAQCETKQSNCGGAATAGPSHWSALCSRTNFHCPAAASLRPAAASLCQCPASLCQCPASPCANPGDGGGSRGHASVCCEPAAANSCGSSNAGVLEPVRTVLCCVASSHNKGQPRVLSASCIETF